MRRKLETVQALPSAQDDGVGKGHPTDFSRYLVENLRKLLEVLLNDGRIEGRNRSNNPRANNVLHKVFFIFSNTP